MDPALLFEKQIVVVAECILLPVFCLPTLAFCRFVQLGHGDPCLCNFIAGLLYHIHGVAFKDNLKTAVSPECSCLVIVKSWLMGAHLFYFKTAM